MGDYEYLKALLNYRKWEKSLKSLPIEERERIMRIYQIEKPKRDVPHITIRALRVNAL